jgi:hypothetical protein
MAKKTTSRVAEARNRRVESAIVPNGTENVPVATNTVIQRPCGGAPLRKRIVCSV